MSEWELARRRKIMAFRFGSRMWITARGMKPSPCYEVEVQQSPLKIFPPQYNVVWRPISGLMCPQVLTPYEVSGVFHAIPGQETVVVHHQGGTDEVKIQEIPVPAEMEGGEAALAAEGGAAGLFTGYSGTSFDEAYQDAVAKAVAHPDELFSVRVVEQGGTHGGIAGINDLFVTVRKLGRGSGSVRPDGAEGEAAATDRAAGATEPAGGDRCDHVVTYTAEQNLYDVIIHAEGVNPTTGWKQWFVMLPIEIWPPQFEVLHQAPDVGGTVESPFHIYTSFPARGRIEEVTVHDANGEHRVKVEWVPD
jgi:flavin-binding protein dodecin